MAIKWGGTNVTAVYWGSTKCSAVYWGSTLVFPGYGGVVLYNGNTFSFPATRCWSRNSNRIITSGSISEYFSSQSSTTGYDFLLGGENPDSGSYYTMNLSSYNYIIIEYSCTDSNNIYLGNTITLYGSTYSSTIDKVAGKFNIYDISNVTRTKCAVSFDVFVVRNISGTVYITKITAC